MSEALTLGQRLDALRLHAFKTGSEEDRAAYLAALSSAFQSGELVPSADLASPTPSLPEDVARVVERLRGPLAISGEHRDEAAALIQSLSSQLAEAEAEMSKGGQVDG